MKTIAIFDIGKTNKKLLLFDDDYRVVYEKSVQLPETKDEDGFPCEDITALTQWVQDSFQEVSVNPSFQINAINFSGYGASFVHLDRTGKVVAPLYNYLKPFPENLKEKYYQKYGSEESIAQATASPVLGNLNSGMQLYWLKHERLELFRQIAVSLHLPQYLSYIFSGHYFSDITSIGCHTQLWDFQQQHYHRWVLNEKINQLLPSIAPSHSSLPISFGNQKLTCGIGLHDSSAALIPFLKTFDEPFLLLSTGTWCISLNPFNHQPLTTDELNKDCLCYLSYEGNPVKASRLFSGHEHEKQTKRMAEHFNKTESYYSTIPYQPSIASSVDFHAETNLSSFKSYEAAYHALAAMLVRKQIASSNLVLRNQSVKRIFVDGGFSKNDVFMNLLAKGFPKMMVYGTSVAQASALGAALVLDSKPERKLHHHFSLHHYSL
jgi:L-fuculokinase